VDISAKGASIQAGGYQSDHFTLDGCEAGGVGHDLPVKSEVGPKRLAMRLTQVCQDLGEANGLGMFGGKHGRSPGGPAV